MLNEITDMEEDHLKWIFKGGRVRILVRGISS
jgi:hypothetical protein